jgi:hypothetical protein
MCGIYACLNDVRSGRYAEVDAGINKQSNVQKHTLFIVYNGTQKKQLAQYTSSQYRRSVSESGRIVISTR